MSEQTSDTRIPPPPWNVAGVIVDIMKDAKAKTLRIVVPQGCMERMTDDEIAELVAFTEAARARISATLPDWTVTA